MALPVVHQTGQRLLLVVAEMKPAPEPPRLDRLLRLPVPECLRDRDLPRREDRFAVHRLVVREDGIPLLRVGQPGPEPRLLGRLPEPVRIGMRAVRWRVSDLDEWAAGRPVAHGELGRQ